MPHDVSALTARLNEILLARSVQRGYFTLTSGQTTDFYIDVRQTTLNAEGCWVVARLMLDRLKPEVKAVGGMTLGADPIACAMAALAWQDGRHLHAFLIRKEAKGHGTGQTIEGLKNLAEGDDVAIVEDTTTTGGSLLRAVERARSAGLNVVQTLTVVDRQEGAADALRDNGCALEALTTRAALIGPA